MGRLMRASLLRLHERRHYLRRNADWPPKRLVDDRPVGARADADLAVRRRELDVTVEAGAARRLTDPGAGGDPLTLKGRAQIVDLVPHYDPVILILVRRIGDRIPMRDGDLLDPLHPHRIVDVPQLVDVLRPGGEIELEDRTGHCTCVSMNA